jgi:flagellar biogenesis protein FliO
MEMRSAHAPERRLLCLAVLGLLLAPSAPARAQFADAAALVDPAPSSVAAALPEDAQPNAGAPLSLSAPSEKNGAAEPLLTRPRQADPGREDPTTVITTLGTSLAVVLGLFFVAAWVMRKSMPRAMRPLPAEAVEMLGRTVLPGRQQMQLVRCGHKLLLVWAGQGAMETLTEIDDPDEVAHLLALCRRGQGGSSSTEFRQVMEHLQQGRGDAGSLSERGPRARKALLAGGSDA